MGTTKLFERLVTKFSIKVNDLARYLEISKASIYNYRNLEEFSQIPNDKQYKIFYLFDKMNEVELQLLLDENDNNMLKKYSDRIDAIFAEHSAPISNISTMGKVSAIADIDKLDNLDELSKKIVLSKVSDILAKLHDIDVKGFADYLDIYNFHLDSRRK